MLTRGDIQGSAQRVLGEHRFEVQQVYGDEQIARGEPPWWFVVVAALSPTEDPAVWRVDYWKTRLRADSSGEDVDRRLGALAQSMMAHGVRVLVDDPSSMPVYETG